MGQSCQSTSSAKTTPTVVSLQSPSDCKSPSDLEKSRIASKQESDNMGHKHIETPEWMQTDARIPAHCASLKAKQISIPFECSKDKWVYVIPNVFTADECESLIALSEQIGYVDALVNIGRGRQQKIPSVRNCKRVMIDNEEMAQHIFARIHRFIPEVFNERRRISLNERLRFLRYHKGEYFAPHFDGVYIRDNKMERSQMSVLVYLNDDYQGGNTNFLNEDEEKEHYAPEITQGMVLIFEHEVYHEGETLLKGTKYIIRTDVMFSN